MQINKSNSKVICIGRNYVDHIKELCNDTPDSPVIFIKPNSAIASCIKFLDNRELHYEFEIVFVFDDAYKIKGAGIGIDITDRNLQSKLKQKGLPWELAKSFDDSAILSNFIAIKDDDIHSLHFKSYRNDILVQEGSYDLMMYKPYKIVEFLKNNNISIAENDFLMTGTPKGVGEISHGDTFRAELFFKDKKILDFKFN